jgi:replicative DNA helicase
MAYYNTYNLGYNLVYISLETSKEDFMMNILCRHSYDTKFPKYNYIPHTKMRMCELTQEEKDYLYDVVLDDYEKSSKGKLVILDESDFETMSFAEIYAMLENIDDKLNGYLDGIVVDYVQLFKYSEGVVGGESDNKVVNSYVSFFRRLSQAFRDEKMFKRLIIILLSQINRDSWKKAAKNEGKYDLTCLADANELERGSHRVITIFTTEEMKINKEAQVQILKNRNGATMWTPEVIFADGEAYYTGEEANQGFQSPIAAVGGNNLGDLFNDDSLGGLI